jgi:predicted AlkP superfamily phosphohydrolase/phosphomutase
MEGVVSNVNVNCYLEEKGFLKRGKDLRKGYNNILEGTRAFALDPGRIYINRTGKYPSGCVDADEEEGVLQELIHAWESLQKDGRPVIKKIWHKDEIYHGRYTDCAPDLVLEADTGFNLKGGILPEKVFDTDMLSGKHNQDAFLYVKGGTLPENPSVEDVVPVLNTTMGW